MQPKHEVIGNKNFNKDLEYCTCIKFYIVSLIFHPLPSMRACPFEFSLWQMHWFLMRLLPQFQFWCVRKPLYGLRNTVALLLAWLSSYWGRSALYFLVPSGGKLAQSCMYQFSHITPLYQASLPVKHDHICLCSFFLQLILTEGQPSRELHYSCFYILHKYQ